MKKKKQSAVLDIMDLVWHYSSRNSWLTLNQGLNTVLHSLIEMDLIFDVYDYEAIWNRYRGHFWLYVSPNGNHYGESLYAAGTRSYNNSFCLSYEKFTNREPFLLGSKRIYTGFEFEYDGLYWTVSGWTKDNKSIRIVGYKNRMKEGKRKLLQLDKDKWLKIRKTIKNKP